MDDHCRTANIRRSLGRWCCVGTGRPVAPPRLLSCSLYSRCRDRYTYTCISNRTCSVMCGLDERHGMRQVGAMVTKPLRHCDPLPDNYRLSQARSISTDETYSTICVEWAGDHFGLAMSVSLIDPLLTTICVKTIFIFSFPVTLTFDL